MTPLRLAVDARVIAHDTRGIGRYARAILRRLTSREDVELTLLADGPFPLRHRAAYARALASDGFFVRGPHLSDVDAIWHPANGTFISSNLPSVVTIHDAVPFRYPDPDPSRRRHAQVPFLRSAQSATRVIAVSRFGAAELQTCLQIAAEKIAIIEHGVDESFSPGEATPLPRSLRSGSFLLFVGDPIGEPRKNFTLLYEAYRHAWPDLDGPTLAIAGPRAPELPNIVWVGNLDDDLALGRQQALRACYRGALALTMASYHETFGMPVLEAMACGTPVIAADAGSLREIGGDAALYAPPDNADAWADLLRRVAEEPTLRNQLRLAGFQRAKAFDWNRSVAAHLRVFRDAAAVIR